MTYFSVVLERRVKTLITIEADDAEHAKQKVMKGQYEDGDCMEIESLDHEVVKVEVDE